MCAHVRFHFVFDRRHRLWFVTRYMETLRSTGDAALRDDVLCCVRNTHFLDAWSVFCRGTLCSHHFKRPFKVC